MGRAIEDADFSARSIQQFQQRLDEDLEALAAVLNRPGFGKGARTFGAELELYIVNAQGRPVGRNAEIQQKVDDPQVTLELNRYNLEYNLTPVRLKGRPFSSTEAQILDAIGRLSEAAEEYGAHVVPIGILPTLKRRDFGPSNMTDLKRYHCLTERLANLRGKLFSIKINGEEPVELRSRDLTLEGANTSLQLHYRVEPAAYARTFNAVQLATPLVLGIASNSPFMIGRRLWHETRIPLFKHAIDGYTRDLRDAHLPSRVDFGNGWVREGVYELFAENVYLHPPLLPICTGEKPGRVVEAGEVPELFELKLHQGTVWPWNRAIYDSCGKGHLRIELRALPAGPSACDMMANAALLIGLTEGLAPQMARLIPAMPYQTLVYNFYRAAQQGMGAKLLWPKEEGGGFDEMTPVELVRRLLPLAETGLSAIGIDSEESRHYLDLIRQRLDAGTNGSSWQLRQFSRLHRNMPRHLALGKMMREYMENSRHNLPIAQWKDVG
ncbi:glutamate--cysteine ligase [Marinobacterium sp. D7]|uniref:glutamate--cysteine ligase n=1 Tax=Marinobacterium ramblicola TaxID=2849041 RepID=UPI001C2DD4A8|nr:glutamate--cysteine ligase [Marinobacterium ramblicola]MBV1790062.1 glutamate--cysteine ligase [Marinobacterium ramblicola]